MKLMNAHEKEVFPIFIKFLKHPISFIRNLNDLNVSPNKIYSFIIRYGAVISLINFISQELNEADQIKITVSISLYALFFLFPIIFADIFLYLLASIMNIATKIIIHIKDHDRSSKALIPPAFAHIIFEIINLIPPDYISYVTLLISLFVQFLSIKHVYSLDNKLSMKIFGMFTLFCLIIFAIIVGILVLLTYALK